MFAALTNALQAATPPARQSAPNFDKRAAAGPRARTPAERAIEARVPGVRVGRDPITERARSVAARRGFLTGPRGEGIGVAAATARGFAANDRDRGVKAFLTEHRPLFGHGPEALAAARKTREDLTAHSGLRTSVWQQELDGVPVFGAFLKAHETARGELVKVGSGFVSDAAPASRAAALARPGIAPAQAVRVAASGIGDEVAGKAVTPVGAPSGTARRQEFRTAALTSAQVELTWLPMDGETVRLCWQVLFTSKVRGELYRVLVDAVTGEELVRHCLTNYLSDATYRVWTSDSPSPFSPGHGTPSSAQPAQVARTLVTLSALDTTASPNGWIDDGVTETRGNNVDAHSDLDANDSPDLPRPNGGAGRVFDFAADLALDPNNYRAAAITDLFYWTNYIHDRFYQLGFTESAGNFQNNNFNRGGLGNDAVQADAQDGSGTNNANFSTPPDGNAPRMQMYIFSGPAPDRDGDFDHEIVIHEYTHGLSNRLVGGGALISQLQTVGMGEGWSDFYALCLLAEPGDDPNGCYAAGAYATHQLGGLTQNYYFGIRRYPYSTQLTKNPLTFKDIDPAQASTHAGVPRSPIIGGAADEVHNMGEVWCAALWDARANLIAKHGFAGNELILQLVTDGMKLSPPNPNFLEARDAIIEADQVRTGGANFHELWAAFAKRGMGSSAISPPSNTTAGLVEAFDLPDDLDIQPNAAFPATGPIGGPFTPSSKVYRLENIGDAPLSWTASKSQPWLTVAPGSGSLGAGASIEVIVTINAGANALPIGRHSDAVTFSNLTSGAVRTRAVSLEVSPPRVLFVPLDSDPGWTRQGQWAFGRPLGLGGASFGHPDPAAGASGTNVFGVNLAGDYSTTVGGPFHLVAGPFNLTNVVQTRLRFQRWLNTDFRPYATAKVEVSNDNTNWTQIFINGSVAEIADSAWTTQQLDISAVADNKPAVFIRWSYQIGADAFAYSGWNIDDIELLGTPAATLTVALPPSVTEGASANGTVTANPVPATDLTVTLINSDPSQLSMPVHVTILAGQASASFTVSATDDALLDGSPGVFVGASAAGYNGTPDSITVVDNESTTLAVILPESAAEGAAGLTGMVATSAVVGAPVTVTLASSDTSELQVPATVTIPTGQNFAEFLLSVVDDAAIDGTQSATVTASVAGWVSSIDAMAITDNESTALALALSAVVGEGDDFTTGTVNLSGTLPADLVVSLSSTNAALLVPPPSVTIRAGSTSADFNIAIQDDPAIEPATEVTITAAAAGFTGASRLVTVRDDDPHHFAIDPLPDQFAGFGIPITIRALDAANQPVLNYGGSVAVNASADTGAVSVTPATMTGFANGVLIGSVTIASPSDNVIFTVNDSGGHAGSSNPFNVVAGAPDFLTEIFGGGESNDTAGATYTFLPINNRDGYIACHSATAAFPTDPAGGTVLALADDASVEVTPTGGAQVRLFGTSYGSFFVCSNGYIGFGANDVVILEDAPSHFAIPRVAALIDDLDPSVGGTISWKQLADRVAVTWQNVPEYAIANSNSFQIELFFDGRIRVTILAIGAPDGIIGLSRGGGVPAGFVESNFSAYLSLPPTAGALTTQNILEDSATVDLPLTIGDDVTPAASLTLAALSSNTTLVPPANVSFGGSGANRTVRVTPVAQQNGLATITVRVTDGDGRTTDAPFVVNVAAVNDAPTLSAIADPPMILEDAGLQAISLGGIAAGPANESAQTLVLSATSSDPALIPDPSVSYASGEATGSLSFAPAANASGSATIIVTIEDSGGTASGGVSTTTRSFTVSVLPVNDPPFFTSGGDVTAIEDSGPRHVNTWAAPFGEGPANESTQSVTFSVSSDNPALFAAAPAIDTKGSLDFTPAPNAHGSATVTVRAMDTGGTANGGSDTSPPQTFTITVFAVNDPPAFTKGADRTVLEDAGTQTLPGWATAITAGAPNESAQNLAFAVSTNNPALFASGPAVAANGTLTFAPAANANGSATVTVHLTDDGGGANASAPQTFTIAVQAVNDAPEFAKGANVAVDEDAPAQRIAGWASAISAGPADEAAQALEFIVTADSSALFSTMPAVAADGTLTFALAPQANGTAAVTVKLRDDGGTASGGADASGEQTFTIAAGAVNDAPGFVKGADQLVMEDAGPQVVTGWASAISAGPANESSQAVRFEVVNDNAALFAVAPAVMPDGTLTYAPAANAFGSATVRVRLLDDGGTERGGNDTSGEQTFVIKVAGVNEPPAFTKGSDVSVTEDSGSRTFAGWATGLSAGPANENAQALEFIVTNDRAALFSAAPAIAPDGTLTFTPAPDANGSATVTVRARDDGGTLDGGSDTSAAQTFSITVSPVNDAPTFLRGADQTIVRGAPAKTVPGWAMEISPGPSDEAGQGVEFIVATAQPQLFAAPPAIAPDGTLSFTPSATASGRALVTIELRDDGGGRNTSAQQKLWISVLGPEELGGSYHGLARTAAGRAAGHGSVGLVALKGGKKGAFTGKLTLAGKAHSFKGRIDSDGNARFGEASSAVLEIKRRNLASYFLEMRWLAEIDGDRIRGAIREGAADLATFEAERAVYDAEDNPVPLALHNPATDKGRYTVLLLARPEPNGGPPGDGWGLLSVSTGGVVKIKGALADGSPFSLATALSAANEFPFYVVLYDNAGSLLGDAAFRDVVGESDVDGADFQWFRPDRSAARKPPNLYPQGWPGGIAVDLAGSRFVPPARGSGKGVLPGVGVQLEGGNARFLGSGGGLAALIDKALTIDAASRVTVLEPGADKLEVTLSAKDGRIKGSFVDPFGGLPRPRRTPFHGVILQKQEAAAGFFLGPSEAGAIDLAPRE